MAQLFPLPRYFLVSVFAALLGCAPKVTTAPPEDSAVRPPVSIIHGDTVVYQLSFADELERGRFGEEFGRFLSEQRFRAQRYDSAGVLTVVKILPSQEASEAPVEAPWFPDEGFPDTTTPLPERGGSLRLYYPRGSIDHPLAVLVSAYPFGSGDSLPGYLTITDSSPSAITLKITRKTVSGTGKKLSALGIIELWTRYVREHPAEGLAAFRSCDGITRFLSGQEAIILGLSASDNRTIRIRLSPPDPQAVARLRSGRLLSAPFGLGSYLLKAVRGKEAVLSANSGAVAGIPFVNKLTVRCGGDPNPLLSFSLGRYDGVLLWSATDIDYSRRKLMKNATCTSVGRDRYFIACSHPDAGVRAFLCSAVSGRELWGNFVKAEGVVIPAVETDNAAPPPRPRTAAAAKPALSEPVTILYRKDDAVSRIIAERLLAAVSRTRVRCALSATDEKSYQAALVGRSYTCAVGWVPETVLSDKSEKLRLASIFFNDELDEGKRIREHRELPLFAIDWYLLAKDRVGLYRGTLSGIYVKREGK